MKRLICMVLAVAMMITGMAAFAESEGPRGGMGGPNGERGGGPNGGGGRMGGGGQTGTAVFTPFKLALQRDMAERFVRYVNELDLKAPDGGELTFARRDGETLLREGT